MRSQYADIFNHNEDAPDYDVDVTDESRPLRAAYSEVLDWVSSQAAVDRLTRVLELGSGTGNLSARIPHCAELVCVDIAPRMESIAAAKLGHLPHRHYVESDLLEFFDTNPGRFDVVISTYAIHHLIEEEKLMLFVRIHDHLVARGRAVFGDLMLPTAAHEESILAEFRARDDEETCAALKEEFFWHVDTATQALESLGFDVRARRFSTLSHGICARKPA